MIEIVELLRENITKGTFSFHFFFIRFVIDSTFGLILDEILPAISLVVTVGVIMVGGYVMSYLVKMEEESVQRQLGAKGLKVFTFYFWIHSFIRPSNLKKQASVVCFICSNCVCRLTKREK